MYARSNGVSKKWRAVTISLVVVTVLLAFSFSNPCVTTKAVDSMSQVSADNIFPNSTPTYDSTVELIVVPGHGVFRGTDATQWADVKQWALEPFQLGQVHLVHAFSQHIRRSIIELLRDGKMSERIVVFSGGQTKRGAGPRSEAYSYYLIAEQTKLFGLVPSEADVEQIISDRVFSEEFARDSYENIIFSICRFKEITGRYPQRLTIVNYDYKRPRFTELHARAIGWPEQSLRYIGIDLPEALALAGVQTTPVPANGFSDAATYSRVKADPYVCRGHRGTRVTRNPQRRIPPYFVSCSEVRGLLEHCGPALYQGSLPWRA